MPDLSEVRPLAEQRKPKFIYDGTPEERLIAAFRAARQSLIETIPPGTTLDRLAAIAANESATNQMNARVPELKTAFQTETDLTESDGLRFDYEGSRQYYLSKYLVACDGLGVYASGYGRKMASEGTFPDYEKSIDDKIDTFAHIIDAHQTGYLAPAMNAEKYAQQAATRGGLVIGAPTAKLVVDTRGVTIVTPDAATSGLGNPWLVVGKYIVYVAFGAMAFYTVYALGKAQIEATATTTRIICGKLIDAAKTEEAAQRAAQSCIDMNREATDLGLADRFLGKDFTKTMGMLAFGAGILILSAMFLPQIAGQFAQAQSTYSQKRLASANRRRGYR